MGEIFKFQIAERARARLSYIHRKKSRVPRSFCVWPHTVTPRASRLDRNPQKGCQRIRETEQSGYRYILRAFLLKKQQNPGVPIYF
jgi:hypothetical protein